MFIILFAFITDQLSKYLAKRSLNQGEIKHVKGRVFLKLSKNYGLSGGIMSKNPDSARDLSAIALINFMVYYFRNLGKERGIARIGWLLMLGGGLSNFHDRIKDGFVTDFICFGSSKGNKGRVVYNLADFYILAGGICALFIKGKD